MRRNVPVEELSFEQIRAMSNQALVATFHRVMQSLGTAIERQLGAAARNPKSTEADKADARTDTLRTIGETLQAEVLRRMGGPQYRAEDYPGTLYVSNANVAAAQQLSGGDIGWVREDPTTLQNTTGGNIVDRATALDALNLPALDDTIAIAVLITPENEAVVYRTLTNAVLDSLLEGEHLMEMVDSIVPWATLTGAATNVQYV